MITSATPLEFAHGPAWGNRLALAPLTNMQSNPDGTLGDDEYRWLVRRAEGGFAMVMTCAAHVSPGGQAFPGQLGICDDSQLPGLTRLADGLRAAGAVSSVQLQHGGRRANTTLTGRPVVAPWGDPSKGAVALTTDEVEQVVRDFVDAAVRAEKAGFDGAEIHGAHGYLIGQFLDARHNDRTDRYGGSATNRFRIVHEIISATRAATSSGFQLGLRLSPERYGIALDESRALAAEVLAAGDLDYLDLSLWDAFKEPYEQQHQGRRLIDHFMDLPRGDTRVGVAGKILDAAGAQECLDRGADFVLIGTAGIIHHDFARQVLADPAYRATEQPVSASHLTAESVGPRFLEYLSTNWDDFVA
ncbi:NADH:flavin oxidoreductase [Gordonia sp. HNM0687]|uniref:NADH:flavin oxidoreductase n=1 Tax=Gordonia mangrovi TaxID=2665643 RepID=A0A6L7GTN5_9ACTN|nr:NADH:flavin oxidoreductase [Gordonia mangrovi]MXP23384.1 NADH:flavin oxidoreductase [Gordonia mangrovi]UVF76713.1 NADH:flavin oxidoreductase [Gordonia mangrovi]